MIETSALVLIASVLISGGLLAVLGDYLGSKVGKARLRLFNLRPRQTAQVITILTGTLIAASTLGINLALSKPLRQGLFELQDILKQLRIAKADLESVRGEKQSAEQQLQAAKQEQISVQKQLSTINQKFNRARQQLQATSGQAQQLRADVQKLLQEREQLRQSKAQLDAKINQLRSEIRIRDEDLQKQQAKIAAQDSILQQRQARVQSLETRLQSLVKQQNQLQAEIEGRDKQISELDSAIAQKDNNLKMRETQLKELETQLTYLQREVEVLEQYYQNYQDLRERKIAILRGQVLSLGAVRILDPKATIQAVDELLRKANRTVLEATNPNNADSDERVVKITKIQVEQLIKQLQDGQDYVVRIISAGNYVQGEKEVRVFADVVPNQKIFSEAETIATVSLDSADLSEEDMQKRVDLLLAATQFRARRAGVVGEVKIEGQIKNLINFVDQLSQTEEGLDEIKAIAVDDTYTIGPLKLRLVAVKDGEILFES